jgi:hypothetical protein
MVAIPMIATAASGLISTYAAYQDAQSQNAMSGYNAAVSAQNAKMSVEEARYALGQAARNAAEERVQTGALIGSQRARMGASGAVVGVGSFLNVELSAREQGEKNAMALMQQGDLEAWRNMVKAGQYERQARLTLMSKKDPNAVLAAGLLQTGAKTVSAGYGASAFASGGSAGTWSLYSNQAINSGGGMAAWD